MSYYTNFVKDFPSRCLDLLKFEMEAKNKNLEVTLLLVVAGQAIFMPYERLDLNNSKNKHPSKDFEKFETARSDLQKELAKKCKDSRLFKDENGSYNSHAWIYKECAPDQVNHEAVPGMRPVEDKLALTIVKILRNALAHGNLRTNGNPIDRLVFLSGIYESPNYNRLECTPDSLRCFLKNWATMLKKLKIDHATIIEGQFGSELLESDAA
ncbi:hypothetical protein FEM03_09685 [Phragmitibacter flavus]|uniref:pEK499-p136 HEPN domain-containing protein n=1 Tax=Phragmitibacter flavus TaxID=2576071 RepID=A0A5R8KFU6_9BACT|nr:hypothetical protein [Phragmitibacter flavus]TLD71167.1 hypothetical protein FEM03_09685 [Phragmitibacter flavus]